MWRNKTVGSLSKLSTHHLRTSGKFFFLRFWTSSLVFTSLKVARIPLSILPPTEYLWHSLRTLLQSGKCLLINSARTFLSASILSVYKIDTSLLKNATAISCLCLPLIPNSTTAHLELSLIHIWRCRRIERCRSRWSPYH